MGLGHSRISSPELTDRRSASPSLEHTLPAYEQVTGGPTPPPLPPGGHGAVIEGFPHILVNIAEQSGTGRDLILVVVAAPCKWSTREAIS